MDACAAMVAAAFLAPAGFEVASPMPSEGMTVSMAMPVMVASQPERLDPPPRLVG